MHFSRVFVSRARLPHLLQQLWQQLPQFQFMNKSALKTLAQRVPAKALIKIGKDSGPRRGPAYSVHCAQWQHISICKSNWRRSRRPWNLRKAEESRHSRESRSTPADRPTLLTFSPSPCSSAKHFQVGVQSIVGVPIKAARKFCKCFSTSSCQFSVSSCHAKHFSLN